MQILLTYPFPDYAGNVIKGDYANVEATVDLDFGTASPPLLPASAPPASAQQQGDLAGSLLGTLLGGGR